MANVEVVVVEAMVETEVEATEETGVVCAMEENKWLQRRPRRLWRQKRERNNYRNDEHN